MANDEDFERIEKVAAFVNDKRRFQAVVATVNRRLRFNRDGSESPYGRMERAETAEDIVSGLVVDAVCGGPRKWDPNQIPSFEKWLFSQIRSAKYNLDRKQRRLREIISYERDPGDDPDTSSPRNGASPGRSFTSGIPEPAGDDDMRTDFENDEFILALTKKLEERPLDSSVFDCVRDGKPDGEIASALHIDIGEVRNAKKRIRRMVDSLLRGDAEAQTQ
jgi:DNA-directed RNA polymerase specialized sigma24 family protein